MKIKSVIKRILTYRVSGGIIGIVSLLILLTLTKGNTKNNELMYQKNVDTKIEGPFELSNSSSRYVLTQAIVDSKTFFLNPERAKTAAPDVVQYKEKYFTIFTPGVSFLGIPFYILGKYFGMNQIFTFAINTLLAFLNIFLVMKVSRKLGASSFAALLGGFVFAFATNALGYSLTFTQHEVSSTLILLGFLNVLGKRNFFSNMLFGLLFSASALMDLPNIFLMLPMLVYIFSRHLSFFRTNEKIHINFKLVSTWLIVGLFPFTLLFGWYNYSVAGSPTKIAQNIGRVTNIGGTQAIQNIDVPEIVTNNLGKPLLKVPFITRNMLNGFYILTISDERSWLYYSPVLLIGIFGLIFAYRSKRAKTAAVLVISVIGTNIVLYSMFGDPWGGWAFGPRYLIPAAAFMSAGVGIAVSKLRRSYIFCTLFLILFAYSVYVSVLGAITTNAIPPKIEAVNFKPALDYTYEYNQNFITSNQSSSLFYNAVLKDKISVNTYWYLLTGLLIFLGVIQYLFAFFSKEEEV